MALVQQLRGRGLELQAKGDDLLVGPGSALTDPLRETIRANKAALLQELEAEAVDYQRGLRLLAELLSREAFVPEPSRESLSKYFPVLCGVLPDGLAAEHRAGWRNRIEHSRGLVTHFGRSGVAPPALLFAVRWWEHQECGRAKNMPVPLAPWRQGSRAERERIRDASRARLPKRSRPTRLPAPPRCPATGEFEKLWALPDPALSGFAAAPEHLQQRLQDDPAYAQRYGELIGEPDAPAVPPPASAAA